MANTRRFLDLSTAHLSHETAQWLDEISVTARSEYCGRLANLLLGGMTPTGWFVYAHTELPADIAADVPEDLKQAFRLAARHRCAYILFDRDAPTDPRLPILCQEPAALPPA